MSDHKHSPAPDTVQPALPPVDWWRRRWVWGVGVIVLLLIALIVWRIEQSSAHGHGTATEPVPVVAALVRRGNFVVDEVSSGTVTPENTVVIRSQVAGRLTKLAFREGEMVKQGALLAIIDPQPFQAQLQLATGKLASDQALLANAQGTLKRYQALLAQDSIERQRVDDQQSRVRQYEATVKVDQGHVETAKLQLDYTRITAPISGMVGLRRVDPGNVVGPNDANGIVRITQLAPTSVVFAVPANTLPQMLDALRGKAPVPVQLIGHASQAILATGQLDAVDNQIDPATGTVKLSATFANGDHVLFPNQAVTVRLPVRTLRGATLVPAAAIQQGAEGAFVYVIRPDHTVTVAPVTVGPGDGTTSVIDKGVTPGAQVVVEGAGQLRAGTRVEVAGGKPPGTAATGARSGVHGRRGDRVAAA